MTAPESPLIAIAAGEASGDLLGAHLVESLKRRIPTARFTGVPGPRMRSAGVETLFPMESLAVRGYAEVLRHLPRILRMRRELGSTLIAQRPADSSESMRRTSIFHWNRGCVATAYPQCNM